jgi:toxin ParE1/3/4
MRFEVVLTQDAQRDLDDLHSYIANYDSLESADRVLDRLLEVAEDLSTNTERGSVPKELRSKTIGNASSSRTA